MRVIAMLLMVFIAQRVAADPAPDVAEGVEKFNALHARRLKSLSERIERLETAAIVAKAEKKKLPTANSTALAKLRAELKATEADPLADGSTGPKLSYLSRKGDVGLMPAAIGKYVDADGGAMRALVECTFQPPAQVAGGQVQGNPATAEKTLFAVRPATTKTAKPGQPVELPGAYLVTDVKGVATRAPFRWA